MTNDESATQNPSITIFTIGFTGHSAEDFFGKLQKASVKTLIDVRLNNIPSLQASPKNKILNIS